VINNKKTEHYSPMPGYRKKVGDFGEDLAVKYLIGKGYKILERNIHTGHQEIDIVVKNNKNLLIFIEVKTRTSRLGEGVESMYNKKLKKLKLGIMKYLSRNRQSAYYFRLDLISIYLDIPQKSAKIKHYKDIF
jgi:putative endonuclease